MQCENHSPARFYSRKARIRNSSLSKIWSVELVLINLSVRALANRRSHGELIQIPGSGKEIQLIRAPIIDRASGKTTAVAYVVAVNTLPRALVQRIQILIARTEDQPALCSDDSSGCPVIELEFPDLPSVLFAQAI